MEPDCDVAQSDGTVIVVEQRPRDDAHRVGEVDDPRVVGGELAHTLRDLEHDRHRAKRLGETTRARGLLADAPAGERHRLVHQARVLPADPDLDQDEVRPVDRAVEVVCDLEAPSKPCASSMRAARPPTTSRRSSLMSWSTSSRTSMRSRSRESPDTSSGVYVEPPPMTAIFRH